MRKKQFDLSLFPLFLNRYIHEMRTPLTSLIGFSDYLLSIQESKKIQDMLQIILANAEMLNDLIGHLSLFFPLSSPLVKPKICSVSLGELVHVCVIEFEKKKHPVAVNLIYELPDASIKIKTDPVWLRPCIEILLAQTQRCSDIQAIQIKIEALQATTRLFFMYEGSKNTHHLFQQMQDAVLDSEKRSTLIAAIGLRFVMALEILERLRIQVVVEPKQLGGHVILTLQRQHVVNK